MRKELHTKSNHQYKRLCCDKSIYTGVKVQFRNKATKLWKITKNYFMIIKWIEFSALKNHKKNTQYLHYDKMFMSV